jgi:hypothetical protein
MDSRFIRERDGSCLDKAGWIRQGRVVETPVKYRHLIAPEKTGAQVSIFHK